MPDHRQHLPVRPLAVPAPQLFHKGDVLVEAKLMEEPAQQPGVVEEGAVPTEAPVPKLDLFKLADELPSQLPGGLGGRRIRLHEQSGEEMKRDVPFVAQGCPTHPGQQVGDAFKGFSVQELQHAVVGCTRCRVQDTVQELHEPFLLRIPIRKRGHVHRRAGLDDGEPHPHLPATRDAHVRIVVGPERTGAVAHFILEKKTEAV